MVGKKYKADVLVGSGHELVKGKPNEFSFYGPNGIAVHEASHSCFITENVGTIKKVSFVNSL